MPRMDGLTFLKILQQHRPMPVVIVSSLTQAGSRAALEAMELGAVDVLAKPNSAWNLGDLRDQLALRVKGAAKARLSHAPKTTADRRRQRRAGACGVHFHRARWLSSAPPPAAPKPSRTCSRGCPPACRASASCSTFRRFFPRPSPSGSNECCALEVREAAPRRRSAARPGADRAGRLPHGARMGGRRLPRCASSKARRCITPGRRWTCCSIPPPTAPGATRWPCCSPAWAAMARRACAS